MDSEETKFLATMETNPSLEMNFFRWISDTTRDFLDG